MSETDNGSNKSGKGGGVKQPPLAVALHYELESEYAPKIAAKGRGAIAEQILQIAFAYGVRVREDAELAELLSLVDVDSEIPLEAFAAVAEILAYVYRANNEMPPIADETTPNGAPV